MGAGELQRAFSRREGPPWLFCVESRGRMHGLILFSSGVCFFLAQVHSPQCELLAEVRWLRRALETITESRDNARLKALQVRALRLATPLTFCTHVQHNHFQEPEAQRHPSGPCALKGKEREREREREIDRDTDIETETETETEIEIQR